jgi:hypothetical protein
MLRAIIGGLTLVVATFGAAPANETIDPNAVDAADHLREVLAAPKAYAQDRSARCVPVENRQMTIASARGHGLDIENFGEVETAAFLKAFNALKPSNSLRRKYSQRSAATVPTYSSSGKDLCTTRLAAARATEACQTGADGA